MRLRLLLVFSICLLSGLFTPAHAQDRVRLRKAVEALKTAKEDTSMVKYLASIAWDTSYDNLALGLQYGEKALRLAEKLNFDDGIIASSNTLGTIYSDMGDLNKALNMHLRGLALAEKTHNTRAMGTAELNVSNVYITMKDFNTALKYLRLAKVHYGEVGNKLGQAVIYNTMGACYLNFKDSTEQALASYSKGFDIATELKRTATVSVSLGGVARCFNLLGDSIRAYKAIERSIFLMDSTDSKYDLAILLPAYASILKDHGRYSQALTALDQAMKIFSSIGMAEQEVEAWHEYADIYEKSGQFEKALSAHKRYASMKDSLLNENVFRKQRELEAVYENEKRENEIKGLKQEKQITELDLAKRTAEKERLTVFVTLGIIALLLVLGFAGYIYFSLQQKKRANSELGKAYSVIEETNKNITDSINYARKIQEAVLPSEAILHNQFSDAFVLFRPRDIVSGDFWWCTEKDGRFILALADCTGHGVPGGFMSVMGAAFLSEIINEKGITDPAEVLSLLRLKVIAALKQTQELPAENKNAQQAEVKDGMDISFCSFTGTNSLQFAGANNPIWIVRKNGNAVEEFAADKFPVGIHHGEILPFTQKQISLQTGDMIYLFSDGYADQFGGPQGKKFKYKQLKELLVSISGNSCNEQHQKMKSAFENWQGKLEQVDDVLVIGIRI